MPFYLPEVIRRLANAGAVLELPTQVESWPAEVDEDALRAALGGFQAELRSVARRASELLASLPDSEEFAHMEDPKVSVADFPPGLYLKLSGTVVRVAEDADELSQAVGSALTATPASLRAAWIEQNIPEELAPIVAGAWEAAAESATPGSGRPMVEEPAPDAPEPEFPPTFRIAAATAAAAAMNTAIASYLLRAPFGIDAEEAVAELTRVRTGSLQALARLDTLNRFGELGTTAEGPERRPLDLEPLAAATLETVAGGLSLALRCLDLFRRRDVGPLVEAELGQLEEVFGEIAAYLPQAPRGAGTGRLSTEEEP